MTYISKPKNKKFVIDVNCDLAQSFGVYKNEKEFELMPYVSTINVSCGAHAGDPLSIMDALSTIEGQNYAVSAIKFINICQQSEINSINSWITATFIFCIQIFFTIINFSICCYSYDCC